MMIQDLKKSVTEISPIQSVPVESKLEFVSFHFITFWKLKIFLFIFSLNKLKYSF